MVPSNDSREHIELLLSGLVIKNQGTLHIKNQIYQTVFHVAWVQEQLAHLRPYAQSIEQWLLSDRLDSSRLLRGQALQDAQDWARDKSLSNLDYQYLAESEVFDRQEVQKTLEAERALESEARLREQRKNVKLERSLLGVIATGFLIALVFGAAICFFTGLLYPFVFTLYGLNTIFSLHRHSKFVHRP